MPTAVDTPRTQQCLSLGGWVGVGFLQRRGEGGVSSAAVQVSRGKEQLPISFHGCITTVMSSSQHLYIYPLHHQHYAASTQVHAMQVFHTAVAQPRCTSPCFTQDVLALTLSTGCVWAGDGGTKGCMYCTKGCCPLHVAFSHQLIGTQFEPQQRSFPRGFALCPVNQLPTQNQNKDEAHKNSPAYLPLPL